MEFTPFPKVPRLSRECVITEKIDGTNASVWIEETPRDIAWDQTMGSTYYSETIGCMFVKCNGTTYKVMAGSRKRFITPGKSTDNFGFAGWVRDNAEELVKLGPGVHYGEWWGKGIQRNYGLDEKRFSLFDVHKWVDTNRDTSPEDKDAQTTGMQFAPSCCHVVPVLWRDQFDAVVALSPENKMTVADWQLKLLRGGGSRAAPGFDDPEGIMIYHTAARQIFKKTFEGDVEGKGV